MKTTSLATILIVAGSTALMAQTVLDADEDGLVTMDELVAVYADVTAEAFAEADADASGALDVDEIAAAQEAGLIPTEM